MRGAMVVVVILIGGAAAADKPAKKAIAETREEAFALVESTPKMQRAALSALLCASNVMRVISRSLVANEKRMARETIYVNAYALRGARHALEKSDEWKRIALKQLRDRKESPVACTAKGIAGLAACIAARESDTPIPEECEDADTQGVVDWALADEK